MTSSSTPTERHHSRAPGCPVGVCRVKQPHESRTHVDRRGKRGVRRGSSTESPWCPRGRGCRRWRRRPRTAATGWCRHRAVDELLDGGTMAAKRDEFGAVRRAPHPQTAVQARAGEVPPVRAEGDGPDLGIVATAYRVAAAAVGVPEPHGVVIAAARHAQAVRAERHGSDRRVVPAQDRDGPAVGGVPRSALCCPGRRSPPTCRRRSPRRRRRCGRGRAAPADRARPGCAGSGSCRPHRRSRTDQIRSRTGR